MSMFEFFKAPNNGTKDLRSEWIVPASTAEVDAMFETGLGMYLIYKHSYLCGTCMFSKRTVEGILPQISTRVHSYFIDVRANRELSVYVEKKSGVKHESPQVLLIKNGRVILHASHSSIAAGPILEKLPDGTR